MEAESDLFAFVGSVILVGGVKGVGFMKVGEEPARTLCFKGGKAFSRFQIGGQYRIPRADGVDAWVFGKAQFVGPHGDRQKVLEWQARDEARKLERRAELVEKKVVENGPLEDQLDKLRRFSMTLTHAERSAFCAYVIKRIM